MEHDAQQEAQAAAAWARSAWERRHLHHLALTVASAMSAGGAALLVLRFGFGLVPGWFGPLSAIGVVALGALAAGLLRVVYTAARTPQRSRRPRSARRPRLLLAAGGAPDRAAVLRAEGRPRTGRARARAPQGAGDAGGAVRLQPRQPAHGHGRRAARGRTAGDRPRTRRRADQPAHRCSGATSGRSPRCCRRSRWSSSSKASTAGGGRCAAARTSSAAV